MVFVLSRACGSGSWGLRLWGLLSFYCFGPNSPLHDYPRIVDLSTLFGPEKLEVHK